jgi:hypothetical protein
LELFFFFFWLEAFFYEIWFQMRKEGKEEEEEGEWRFEIVRPLSLI